MSKKPNTYQKARLQYPNSAILFAICKERYQSLVPVKVRDIDIGNLISLDQSGTTQWKMGIKKMHDVILLKTLAKEVKIPLLVMVKILEGEAPAKYKAISDEILSAAKERRRHD